MNLVKIIDEFKLQKCGAFICKKCDADIPDIKKYKYSDIYSDICGILLLVRGVI